MLKSSEIMNLISVCSCSNVRRQMGWRTNAERVSTSKCNSFYSIVRSWTPNCRADWKTNLSNVMEGTVIWFMQQILKMHERKSIVPDLLRMDNVHWWIFTGQLSLKFNTALWILHCRLDPAGLWQQSRRRLHSLKHSLAESPVALAQGLSW